MRSRAIVSVVLGAMLMLTSCGGPNEYDPIPASAWPDLAGVQVVSSQGLPGNECCESHRSERQIQLAVESTDDFDAASDLVGDELRELGWTDFDCVKTVCMQHGDYRVALWHPHGRDNQRHTDIVLQLTRDANLGD